MRTPALSLALSSLFFAAIGSGCEGLPAEDGSSTPVSSAAAEVFATVTGSPDVKVARWDGAICSGGYCGGLTYFFFSNGKVINGNLDEGDWSTAGGLTFTIHNYHYTSAKTGFANGKYNAAGTVLRPDGSKADWSMESLGAKDVCWLQTYWYAKPTTVGTNMHSVNQVTCHAPGKVTTTGVIQRSPNGVSGWSNVPSAINTVAATKSYSSRADVIHAVPAAGYYRTCVVGTYAVGSTSIQYGPLCDAAVQVK